MSTTLSLLPPPLPFFVHTQNAHVYNNLVGEVFFCLGFFAVQFAVLVAEALEQQLRFVRESRDSVAHLFQVNKEWGISRR